MPIYGVGLTISFNNDIAQSGYTVEKKTDITVSIGDGNKTLMKNYYGDIKSTFKTIFQDIMM